MYLFGYCMLPNVMLPECATFRKHFWEAIVRCFISLTLLPVNDPIDIHFFFAIKDSNLFND